MPSLTQTAYSCKQTADLCKQTADICKQTADICKQTIANLFGEYPNFEPILQFSDVLDMFDILISCQIDNYFLKSQPQLLPLQSSVD